MLGIPGALLYLAVIGVDLMDLGVHFGGFVSLRDPIPGLLIYLGIYVELGQENLDITLVLDVQKTRLELISEGQILVAVPLACWISASSTD